MDNPYERLRLGAPGLETRLAFSDGRRNRNGELAFAPRMALRQFVEGSSIGGDLRAREAVPQIFSVTSLSARGIA